MSVAYRHRHHRPLGQSSSPVGECGSSAAPAGARVVARRLSVRGESGRCARGAHDLTTGEGGVRCITLAWARHAVPTIYVRGPRGAMRESLRDTPLSVSCESSRVSCHDVGTELTNNQSQALNFISLSY